MSGWNIAYRSTFFRRSIVTFSIAICGYIPKAQGEFKQAAEVVFDSTKQEDFRLDDRYSRPNGHQVFVFSSTRKNASNFSSCSQGGFPEVRVFMSSQVGLPTTTNDPSKYITQVWGTWGKGWTELQLHSSCFFQLRGHHQAWGDESPSSTFRKSGGHLPCALKIEGIGMVEGGNRWGGMASMASMAIFPGVSTAALHPYDHVARLHTFRFY